MKKRFGALVLKWIVKIHVADSIKPRGPDTTFPDLSLLDNIT